MNVTCAVDLMTWADWGAFILLMILGNWKMYELLRRFGKWIESKL